MLPPPVTLICPPGTRTPPSTRSVPPGGMVDELFRLAPSRACCFRASSSTRFRASVTPKGGDEAVIHWHQCHLLSGRQGSASRSSCPGQGVPDDRPDSIKLDGELVQVDGVLPDADVDCAVSPRSGPPARCSSPVAGDLRFKSHEGLAAEERLLHAGHVGGDGFFAVHAGEVAAFFQAWPSSGFPDGVDPGCGDQPDSPSPSPTAVTRVAASPWPTGSLGWRR
ncbi:hypothetical protein SAMN04489745_3160 [Arthrobacter woluwensis]|uniref:Uncharacterized protein n=1 Tax=Arthrobacter woluwensis TaxID=156980 RepID=A0A1H4TGC4_9MICC|nr:hypothetical protein SAMN04489745_3160 [Arthrobacter woluwensis]